MQVPYINIGIQYKDLKQEILNSFEKLLNSGMFILGEEVSSFEDKFATYCGTKYAVGLNSGTDALILTLQAYGIGEGDEVIVPPNSFLASASAVALVGATPVFVDVNKQFTIDYSKIEASITPKTKAIMPVHLTGRPADMDEINEIAFKHNLLVIEDAAQAVGAKYKGKKIGSIGNAGCFSLHPLKNLSAGGDGGMITTNDKELYDYLLIARNHGLKNRDECEFWSLNSRLDAMQAALLNVKIAHTDKWNNRRREIAHKYQLALKDLVTIPTDDEIHHSVYHTFIIQTNKRDELQKYLAEQGVDSKVHYPIPIHLQEAAAYLGNKKGDFPITEKQSEEILSLPIFPELTNEQVDYVIQKIIEFFK
jgi:dTDP-4-amino-4,6-dideoxygalactose transaminase